MLIRITDMPRNMPGENHDSDKI